MNVKNTFRWIGKIILRTIFGLLLLLVLLFFAIHLPPVQNFITNKAENFLEEKLETKVEIDKISFTIWNSILLEGIYVEDNARDTLVYLGGLDLNYSIAKLLQRKIQFKSLAIHDLYLHADQTDSTSNFQFILDAFASDTTVAKPVPAADPTKKLGKPWVLLLKNTPLAISNLDAHFRGYDLFIKAKVETLKGNIPQGDLTNLDFDIADVLLENAAVEIVLPPSDTSDVSESTGALRIKLGEGDIRNTAAIFQQGSLRLEGKISDFHVDKLLVDQNEILAVAAENLQLKDSKFRYDLTDQPVLTDFDYNHLYYDTLNLSANKVRYDSLIVLDKVKLSGQEIDGKKIKAQASSAKIKLPYEFEVEEVILDYAQTKLNVPKAQLVLPPNDEGGNLPIGNILLDVLTEESKLRPADITFFAPSLKKAIPQRLLDQIIDFKIVAKGSPDALEIETFNLNSPDIKANITGKIAQTLSLDKTSVDLNIQQLDVHKSIVALLPKNTLPDSLNLPDKIAITGRLDGKLSNINTNLRLNTSRYVSNSRIALRLEGNIQRMLDFPKTSFDLKLKELLIPKSELELLPPPRTIPASINLPDQLALSGTFKGKVTALNYDLLLEILRVDDISRITSAGLVNGLTVDALPTIDAKLQAKPINPAEIMAYLPDSLLPSYVFMPIIDALNVDFKGTPNDFIAKGKLLTNATTADFKGSLKDSSYTLNLGLKDVLPTVLVDTIMLDSLLGFIPHPFDLNANVKGTGFDWKKDMQTNFNLSLQNSKDVSDLDFVLGGSINRGLIKSKLTANEEYLVLFSQQNADFRGETPIFDLDLNLEKADFRQIPMIPLNFQVAMRMKAQVEGIELNNLTGAVFADSLSFWGEETRYDLDSISIKASLQDSLNKLDLNSEILDMQLAGKFDLKDIAKQLEEQFLPYFTEVAKGEAHEEEEQQADIKLLIDLKNPELFTDILVPGLEEISPFTLSANLNHAQQKANITTEIYRIRYQGLEVDTLAIDVVADKDSLNYKLLLSHANYNESIQIDRFKFSGYVDQGAINSTIAISDEAEKEKYKLQFSFKQVGDDILLRLAPKQNLNYQPWEIAPENELLYTKNGLKTKSFRIGNQEQAIEITGAEGEAAKLVLSKIDLSVLNAFSPVKDLAGGFLSGVVSLNVPFDELSANADLKIEELAVQKTPFGDLAIKADYGDKKAHADVELIENGNRELFLNADVDLAGKEPKFEGELFLDVGLSRFGNLAEGIVNAAEGRLMGDVKFNGTPTEPRLNGDFFFKDATVNLSLTNSPWKLGEQKLTFVENVVSWNNLTLKDINDKSAYLNAEITVNSFEEIPTKMSVIANDFLVLNTNAENGADYYGTLLADLQVLVNGNLFTPKAKIEVQTQENSKITYVVSSGALGLESDVGIVEWIEFDVDSSELKKADKSSAYLMPFAVSAEIKVTIAEKLQLKVITDTYTGDFFEGKAKGDLILGYEQATDDMTLVGTVKLEQGLYRFSYEEIIRKKFEMKPGGSLRWTGDPLAPLLDIDVYLKVRTNPVPLVNMFFNEDDISTPKRPQIFYGTLHIRGDVNEPDIKTELVFPDDVGNTRLPQVETSIARVNEDQALADRQVFGLILFGGFISDIGQSKSSDAGSNVALSAVQGNLNQIVTQQLNNLASRYINFVDLQLGLDSYQNDAGETQTEFKIGISKTFLDDRLSIQVDGVASTDNNSDGDNASSPAYIKDIIVEYKLTKKGGLKIKLSSEQEYDEYIGGQGVRTAGTLIFSADFKKFKLLLKPKKGKNKPKG